MKKFLTMITMLAFCVSPAAFGGQTTAQALYKSTYVDLKQGKDGAQVLRSLIENAKRNNMTMKDVLEAAVAKGWMSQDQLNTVMDVAAKNASLANDKDLVSKLQANKLSAPEMKALVSALQGQITGAAYHCGYYGCYYDDGAAIVLLSILILALILTPVYVVVWY